MAQDVKGGLSRESGAKSGYMEEGILQKIIPDKIISQMIMNTHAHAASFSLLPSLNSTTRTHKKGRSLDCRLWNCVCLFKALFRSNKCTEPFQSE